jgi:hypothetical protein
MLITCRECSKEFAGVNLEWMGGLCRDCRPESVFIIVMTAHIAPGVRLVQRHEIHLDEAISLTKAIKRASDEKWPIANPYFNTPDVKTEATLEHVPPRDILNSLGL